MSQANECKIYVGNLPFSMGFLELKELFAPCGEVVESTVIVNQDTGRSKGFGFVTFKNKAATEKAVKDFDGKEVKGRTIKVNFAKPMERKENNQNSDGEAE